MCVGGGGARLPRVPCGNQDLDAKYVAIFEVHSTDTVQPTSITRIAQSEHNVSLLQQSKAWQIRMEHLCTSSNEFDIAPSEKRPTYEFLSDSGIFFIELSCYRHKLQ